MSDLETIHFRIFNIEEYTTSNDNDCVKVHGQPTSENNDFTLWVFNDDWMEELLLRENDYLGEEFEVLIQDKTGGSRNHVWGESFWPVKEELQQKWFDKYLESRNIEKEKPSDEEVEQILKRIGENYGMSFEDESGGDETEKPVDRNTRIENQAAMHFASRIVGAKIQSDSGAGETTYVATDDEKIEEELNKWMRKFKRGVTTGKIQ